MCRSHEGFPYIWLVGFIEYPTIDEIKKILLQVEHTFSISCRDERMLAISYKRLTLAAKQAQSKESEWSWQV